MRYRNTSRRKNFMTHIMLVAEDSGTAFAPPLIALNTQKLCAGSSGEEQVASCSMIESQYNVWTVAFSADWPALLTLSSPRGGTPLPFFTFTSFNFVSLKPENNQKRNDDRVKATTIQPPLQRPHSQQSKEYIPTTATVVQGANSKMPTSIPLPSPHISRGPDIPARITPSPMPKSARIETLWFFLVDTTHGQPVYDLPPCNKMPNFHLNTSSHPTTTSRLDWTQLNPLARSLERYT
ncbi:uncharacterized protein BDR25DRAFT_356900 [Lindgomyces ingoldianus]|uniref:Uncharacterized protein n=1 Tax=Lindgomyces ingoldianus TaxID=673940 RepID=A0ACB6QQ54_9PLEO|nr:uncharacterized protein BDR25DRAFT_356900 [Lindgomyces ingoldianus]KAF2469119.1 hypothetical protein BDR25DRAFT_356900 [Lindgomyces ingoldianus]